MPKIVDDEKTFQAVVETVLQRGYAGATTKQMAEAAGISEVTLFRKYGSKAELVKMAMLTVMARTDLASKAHYTGDLFADLLRMVQAYQDSVEQHGPFFLALLSEIPRYPELADLLDSPVGLVGSFGQLLARYQAEGALVQEHPLQAVTALISPLIFTNLLRTTRPDMAIPPLDLSAHVGRYLNGRGTNPTL